MVSERIDVPEAGLGESPRWFAGHLSWVDISAGDVFRLTPSTGRLERTRYDDVVSLVWPTADGGRLLAIGADVILEGPDGRSRLIARLGSGEMRCNDGAYGPDGFFYMGTMRRDVSGRSGALWRLERDGGASLVLEGLGVSNGIGFDRTRHHTYFVDSHDRRIDRLDLSTGARKLFVEFRDEDGWPDGLAVDAAGSVWIALFGAGEVRSYSRDGIQTGAVAVAAPNVTSCAFGGRLCEISISRPRATA